MPLCGVTQYVYIYIYIVNLKGRVGRNQSPVM